MLRLDEGFFSFVPEEVLLFLFRLLPAKTLRLISTVHSSWAKCSALALLEHYKMLTPYVRCEGYFLSGLLRAMELLSPELMTLDTHYIFKEYMSVLFEERVQESLLSYTQRISQNFLTNDGENITKNQLRKEYIAHQNQGHAQRVAFLFDVPVLKEFAQALEKFEQKAILSSHEFRLLAQVLWAARKVESWLQLLILFNKHVRLKRNIHSLLGSLRWKLLQTRQYTRMLRGHGLVALSFSGDFYDVMDKLINFHFTPPESWLELRPQAIEFLLSRLTSKDLLTCVPYHTAKLENAIAHQHPQIIALLSIGTLASDTSLIILCSTISNKELLAQIKESLLLVQRLTHPLFLQRFANSSLISECKKYNFAKNLLGDKDWVTHLQEDELLLLIALLKTSYSGTAYVTTLLSFLKDLKRLTTAFLVSVAHQPQQYHGEYAVLIGNLEFTRALLAQSDPQFSFEIAKLALNPHYASTVCPLFTDTSITQHWTIPQVEELLVATKNYPHRNILQTLLQDKRQQLQRLKQYEALILSRPLPKRIAYPPTLFLSPSVRFLEPLILTPEENPSAPIERRKASLCWVGVIGASAVLLALVLGIILVHVLGGPLTCLITLAGLAAVTLVVDVALGILALRSRKNALTSLATLTHNPALIPSGASPDLDEFSPLLETASTAPVDSTDSLIGEGYASMYTDTPFAPYNTASINNDNATNMKTYP